MAYQQYTAWSHYFEVLGKRIRVVILSCVIKVICGKFPNFPPPPPPPNLQYDIANLQYLGVRNEKYARGIYIF